MVSLAESQHNACVKYKPLNSATTKQ
uniref:Uncharacterized protein n=1 Tax=Arabidopsis thaliana TaxID=3702 RepID=Q56XA6_ARATH|nr:hypothetical protein [Arabidopsis thaliana]